MLSDAKRFSRYREMAKRRLEELGLDDIREDGIGKILKAYDESYIQQLIGLDDFALLKRRLEEKMK